MASTAAATTTTTTRQQPPPRFPWIGPYDLTPDTLDARNLYVLDIASEGDMRSGHRQTADEIKEQAASLRATARHGSAIIDISHARTPDHPRVPELRNRYPDELGTGDLSDVGRIIDAQSVDVDGRQTLQALATVTHEGARKLIEDKKIMHNSTTNLYRECVDVEGEPGTCELRGSTIVRNSLLLDTEPNDTGTRIHRLTADDLGTVISAKRLENSYPVADIFRERENGLREHRTPDGAWINAQSAKKYLVSEKGMDATTAARVGRYLTEHPDILTDTQLESYSSSDIIRAATDHQMAAALDAEVGTEAEPAAEPAAAETAAEPSAETGAAEPAAEPAAAEPAAEPVAEPEPRPAAEAEHVETAPAATVQQNERASYLSGTLIPQLRDKIARHGARVVRGQSRAYRHQGEAYELRRQLENAESELRRIS